MSRSFPLRVTARAVARRTAKVPTWGRNNPLPGVSTLLAQQIECLGDVAWRRLVYLQHAACEADTLAAVDVCMVRVTSGPSEPRPSLPTLKQGIVRLLDAPGVSDTPVGTLHASANIITVTNTFASTIPTTTRETLSAAAIAAAAFVEQSEPVGPRPSAFWPTPARVLLLRPRL